MKTALLVATGVLTGSSATAAAGGYVGLALGTQPSVNRAFDKFAPPSGRSLRLLGGWRFAGDLSVEGAVNGFGVVGGGVDRTVYQLSAAVKYNHPLGDGFEALGRAGVERTWLSLDDERYDLGGTGFLLGAGFEYHLAGLAGAWSGNIAGASLFVDYTVHHATLKDARNGKVDETSGMWGLGFSIGF